MLSKMTDNFHPTANENPIFAADGEQIIPRPSVLSQVWEMRDVSFLSHSCDIAGISPRPISLRIKTNKTSRHSKNKHMVYNRVLTVTMYRV